MTSLTDCKKEINIDLKAEDITLSIDGGKDNPKWIELQKCDWYEINSMLHLYDDVYAFRVDWH